jgi:hypothetical protein
VFVQVIHGPVHPGPDAREMLERWLDEVKPEAIGWLGTTAGVTPDGELWVIARFATEQEARRNSERREQDAWWTEMEKRFAAPPTFHDCDDVAPVLEGGRDDAGFVQVLQWPSAGSRTAAELAEIGSRVVREYRPDVLGGLIVVARDGAAFEVVYFSSEEEARRAEAQPLQQDALEEMQELMEGLGEPSYHDLPDPMLAS